MKIVNYLFLNIFLFSCMGCSSGHQEKAIQAVEFLSGDLVFRRGNSLKSDAVLYADKSGNYSHIGIVVAVDSAFKVVHIEPDNEYKDRIKKEELAVFFAPKNAKAGAVMRFSDSLCAERAAEYALCRYDEQEITFDHDYDLDNNSKMYCTELVWLSYLESGIDISENRRSSVSSIPSFSGTYLFPSDIFKNTKLKTIYKF